MADAPYLSDDFLRQLTAAGRADILVAIPTSNNRDTVEQVTTALRSGLARYFPREKAAILNADAGSHDETPAAFRAACASSLDPAPLRSTIILTTSYHHQLGEGGALRLMLAAADLLRVKACALVSPDVTSVVPEWINALVRPVYGGGFDYVSPLYQRGAFEGLLVRNLISPVVRAAFGYRIVEPAAAEAGFSGAVACHFLAQDVWQKEFLRHGATTWMTTATLAGGFRMCEAFLGPKVSAAARPESDLVVAIQRGVGALFGALELQEDAWLEISGSQAVPRLSDPPEENGWQPARVNRKRLFEMFRRGIEEIGSILEQILTPETLGAIRQVAAGSGKAPHFPDELWVNTVYEFAGSFRRRVMNRDHLLQALAPVYRGRIGSYLLENAGTNWPALKERNEALQVVFERMKPSLVEAWRGKM